MTIIVETGAIVANSNSYGSEAGLTTYATLRGTVIPTIDREKYLILAMDYLESLIFKGFKQTQAQTLQWPRYGVVIDGYPLASYTIPADLIKVQYETALAIYNGNDPLQDRPRDMIMEKIGPITVQYSDNASSIVLPVKINALLWKLLANGGTGGFVVSKA